MGSLGRFNSYKDYYTFVKAIENLNSNITCFLIAHRLETLKNCTQIITLEHGEIISTGVYEEIIKNDT